MTGRTFSMQILASRDSQRIEDVSSFVGEDASGSFGLMAGHAPWLTVLAFGLFRFRCGDQPWRYLAIPGGLARFEDNQLTVTTRRYVMDTDYQVLRRTLQQDMLAEEQAMTQLRGNLQVLERDLVKRLWDMGRGQETAS